MNPNCMHALILDFFWRWAFIFLSDVAKCTFKMKNCLICHMSSIIFAYGQMNIYASLRLLFNLFFHLNIFFGKLARHRG